jgi:hypothetical protein
MITKGRMEQHYLLFFSFRGATYNSWCLTRKVPAKLLIQKMLDRNDLLIRFNDICTILNKQMTFQSILTNHPNVVTCKDVQLSLC